MTESVWELIVITIGVCYCFYKFCEIILTFIKAKFNYSEEIIDKPKIDIKVGDAVDENKDNTETHMETNKE